MEIAHVREFITLAHLQNFMAAADELYISQSSLSKHIKTIESELGVSLFDRTTRKVQLIRFGAAFLPYAEQMVASEKEAHSALARLSHDTDETLWFGVLPVFSIYGIYDYLTVFRANYPTCTVNLREGSNDEMLTSLVDGDCNLIMLRHNPEGLGPQFQTIHFKEDHLVLALPPGHPLDDGRRSISVEELDGMNLVSSTSSFVTRTVNHLAETAGIRIHLSVRFNHSSSVVTYALKENVPMLLQKAPTEYRHGGKVKIIEIEPKMKNIISFVYMKNKPLNTAVRGFLKTVFPDLEVRTNG